MNTVAREIPTARSIDYFNLSNAIAYLAYLKEYKPATPAPHLDLSEYAAHIFSSTVQHYLNLGMALRPLELTRLRWGTQPDFQIKDMRGFVADERALTEEQQFKNWRVAVDDLKIRGPVPGSTDFRWHVFSGHGRHRHRRAPGSQGHHRAAASPLALALRARLRPEIPAGMSAGPPLARFRRPRQVSEFFQGANRYDAAHLNTRGANLWSRLLADQIGELIRSGRLEHPTSCDRAKR